MSPDDVIVLPLRGLAGEGAEELVRAAMDSCPGVTTVEVHQPEFLVHIGFDATITSGTVVREHFRRSFHHR